MPAVVPMPSNSSCPVVSEVRSVSVSAEISSRAIPTPMTTRLLATGAQAGTPNFSLVFRIAPNSAAIP